MPILNRIKFDGTHNNEPWLIYKWEKEDIILGSQLIVGPGQEAIFVKMVRRKTFFFQVLIRLAVETYHF